MIFIKDLNKKHKHGGKLGLYLCNGCNKEVELIISKVNRGEIKSCNCMKKQLMAKAKIKHGLRFTSEYKAWQSIKERCLNKSCINYKRYGAKGITICDRWLVFENFYADMGPKPSKEYSIDRINNLDNYYKENCKWATKKEQANNRNSNKLITYNGETHTTAEWANKININPITFRSRLRNGWSIEKAIFTSCQIRSKNDRPNN